MKIALVAQHATPMSPRAGSGPESDDIGLSELTRKLADHGHKVTIYAQKQDPDVPDRAELGDGVRVEHIDAGPVPAAPADGKQDDSGLLDRVPAFSGPLRSSWEQERPDIVHALRWTSGLAALAAARDHHIPVVQAFSSLGVTEPRGLARADGAAAARIRLEPAIGRSAAAVVATHSAEVSDLANLGVHRSSIRVVPWGVNTSMFTPDGPVAQRNGRPRLLTVADLRERAALETLLRALTRVPNAYSANNMPYSALGGVMTGDINERAKLNSYRFVAVNIAQFIVGGFTLPLVANFAAAHAGNGDTATLADKQYGWSMTMTIWAGLCLVLFLTTFFTTRERIEPVSKEKTPPKQDFADLFRNNPWKIMWAMTLVHFCVLSFRGGAYYNYYHHYADRSAMYEWVSSLHLGLTAPPLAPGEKAHGFVDNVLGYVVHADKSNLAGSNVADVANSLINMINTGTTIIFIILTASFAKRFGKKVVAATGFGLATITSLSFYLLSPTNVWGMVALTFLTAVFYAPTIAMVWAIYADCVDYSEWKTGRRATGMVFATIGFALKSGLALGSASFLWLMVGLFHYDSHGTPVFAKGDVNNVPSILNVSSLADKLKTAGDPVSVYVKDHLSAETKQAIANYQDSPATRDALETLLISDLNKLIQGPSIYDASRFAGVKLKSAKQEMDDNPNPKDYDLVCLNRSLLEDAYPKIISDDRQQTLEADNGFRICSGLFVGAMFGICALLLSIYPLSKKLTIQIADELAERRKKASAQTA